MANTSQPISDANTVTLLTIEASEYPSLNKFPSLHLKCNTYPASGSHIIFHNKQLLHTFPKYISSAHFL